MSKESTWTREATIKLIELYKKMPSLYAVDSPDYHNRSKRQFYLENIANNEELLKLRPSTTDAHVKKKLVGLRTQFLKAESLIKASKSKIGSGGEESYIPTLWCFDRLGFLSKHTKNFTSKTNMPAPSEYDSEGNNFNIKIEPEIDCDEEEEVKDEYYLDNAVAVYETPATSIISTSSNDQRGKKRKSSESLSDEILREASEALKRVTSVLPTPSPSKIDIFLQLIGADLKEIQSKTILRAIQNKIIIDVGNALEEDEKNRS